MGGAGGVHGIRKRFCGIEDHRMAVAMARVWERLMYNHTVPYVSGMRPIELVVCQV